MVTLPADLISELRIRATKQIGPITSALSYVHLYEHFWFGVQENVLSLLLPIPHLHGNLPVFARQSSSLPFLIGIFYLVQRFLIS